MWVVERGFTYGEYTSMALAEVKRHHLLPEVKSNLKEWKLTAGSYP